MTVGERIRNARKNAGLTQKQLGEKCGIAEPTIRRYELGKLNPKYETLQKIASALEIPLSQILPINEQIGLAALDYLSPETNEGRSRQLHLSFDLLSEDNQIKVIDYSDNLLKVEMYDKDKQKEQKITRLREQTG